jgi:fatty-acyl-CoA synthase/long-chain acyl-CoA synthetase
MVEIVLFDDDGNEVVGIGPDHPGQLFVKAPAVLNTYYKQEDKFQADRHKGYQTVGDVAYRDDEGYFYICDRKKDMIISGGMNIYPAEIEAVLDQHPDVYEATVFGIPSDEWGETVHAVVVKRPGAQLSEDELTSYAKDHLAGYKVPRSISWIDELPKTGSGKVLKRELRAPYWAGRSSQV